MKPAKVPVSCPHCGQVTLEPASAYSTVCPHCRSYFRVQEALRPIAAPKPAVQPTRQLTCSTCGTQLVVAPSAQSTICKRCASYFDLQDYRITSVSPRTIHTKGRLVIEESGALLNTDSSAGCVVLRGRVVGKIVAEESLEWHSTGQVKGSFQTPLLIIPAGAAIRWPEVLKVGGAEIAGELVANLTAEGRVVLKGTARFFGQLRAGNLAVESGAVFVGGARVST